MHHIEKVIDTIIRPKYYYYFITNASNDCLTVQIKPRNEYKTGLIIPYSQYIYLWISQSFINAPYIYSQFNNMVFGYLPKNAKIPP